MGMYTGIRFKGIVKPEYRIGFECIAMEGDWENSSVPEFREFGEMGRSSFIPCGCLAYMPDEWDDDEEFERSYDKESGRWVFQCSLKNYELEIETFFCILPMFMESIEHLEYYYEEMICSQKYELIDGKVVMTNDQFIKYDFYD